MSLPLEELQNRIGYTFQDPELLKRALTHSSFANETGARNHHLLCNERLEFLGDSVLSIVVSEYIFRNFKQLPEGELTKLRASLVCEKTLAVFAKEIELGRFLFLGKGEQQNGGRERPSILADAFEAVLAAIYLDGGFEKAKTHVLRFIKDELFNPSETESFKEPKRNFSVTL